MFGWRPGIIYAYSTLDVYGKKGERDDWAYVGQTRQALSRRHEQHMASQPWSDLYPEIRIIFNFQSCPNWWLTMVEKYTIWVTRPTYNYEYNTKNKYRIPKYKATQDRKVRDGLRGVKRRGKLFS